MQLLVSVSDAMEAADALDGGADIVDAKDPSSGPLGPVTLETLNAIRLRTGARRPLSAALGDPSGEVEAQRMASAFIHAGAAVVKVGFLAARDCGDVQRLVAGAVSGAEEGKVRLKADPTEANGVIAVAYADHAPGGVTPWRLIDIACSAGANGILLDTADKLGPGLLSLFPPETLQSWIHEASSAGLLVAIAGRLSEDDVMRLRDASADIVGVRGAACVGGRTGRISADNVRRLKELCARQR